MQQSEIFNIIQFIYSIQLALLMLPQDGDHTLVNHSIDYSCHSEHTTNYRTNLNQKV